MVDLMTVAYTVAFFLLFVVPMLYLTWRSLGSDVHSPTAGEDSAE
jgi:ABC-type transport system involved in cytochrome bd biosynthesis fused ATPase/permease subunit